MTNDVMESPRNRVDIPRFRTFAVAIATAVAAALLCALYLVGLVIDPIGGYVFAMLLFLVAAMAIEMDAYAAVVAGSMGILQGIRILENPGPIGAVGPCVIMLAGAWIALASVHQIRALDLPWRENDRPPYRRCVLMLGIASFGLTPFGFLPLVAGIASRTMLEVAQWLALIATLLGGFILVTSLLDGNATTSLVMWIAALIPLVMLWLLGKIANQ